MSEGAGDGQRVAARPASTRTQRQGTKNIEALVGDGGEITPGRSSGIGCAASAAEGHSALARLATRNGETLDALIERLDGAIDRHHDRGEDR